MMRFNDKAVLLVVMTCMFGLSGCTVLQKGANKSDHLRCEHKADPLGIDVLKRV